MADKIKVKFMFGQMTINLDGIDKASQDLEAIRARAKNLRPVFSKLIAPYLMRITRQNFSQEGRPTKWQALADATIADRMRQGYGAGPILVRTGQLMNSLANPGAPYQILEMSASRLRYGTRDPKAIYHQKGTRFMPQRLVLAVTQQDERVMGQMIKSYIVGGG